MDRTKVRATDRVPLHGLHTMAEGLLREIASLEIAIKDRTAAYDGKIAAITAEYFPVIEFDKAAKAGKEGELLGLMKASKSLLFAASDVVNLKAGQLLHTVDKRNVVLPGKYPFVIAILKRLGEGFTEAIKVGKESLDRDVIKAWPDDKIAQIGAVRKPKDEFAYELK